MAKNTLSRWAAVAAALAVIVVLVSVIAGFGSRWGWWHFRTGFQLLRYGVYGSMALIPIALIAMARSRPGSGRGGFAVSIVSLLLAIALIGNALKLQRTARSVPPIHDITTNTENPPQFVAVAPLRATASNPVEYGGSEIAVQQKAAYPDIQTIHLDAPPAVAYQRALDAAERMGWAIVDADSTAGRIEATATTFWFGFKDDVVIRIESADSGSDIDVRSKSRVGRSDVGANAARIREYRRKLVS